MKAGFCLSYSLLYPSNQPSIAIVVTEKTLSWSWRLPIFQCLYFFTTLS